MKIDKTPGAQGGALQQLFFKKTAKASPKKHEPSAPNFEAELQQEKARDEKDGVSSSSKRASSSPARTSPLEALLVSHATNPRPASLIDTKKQNVKAPSAPAAEADAVATRAKLQPTLTTAAAKAHEPSKPREAKPTHADPHAEKKDEFKLEPAASKPAAPSTPTAMDHPSIEAPQPMLAANPVHEAAPLAPVAPLMLEDASVRAVLLPTVARVSLEAGEAGRLNVQLKVNDGVTEIRATGPAAQLLESRQGELRVALAKEGLALGHFDLTQGQGQHAQHQRGEVDEGGAVPLTRKPVASSQSTEAVRSDGRLHVKA